MHLMPHYTYTYSGALGALLFSYIIIATGTNLQQLLNSKWYAYVGWMGPPWEWSYSCYYYVYTFMPIYGVKVKVVLKITTIYYNNIIIVAS
jgi:hypothetical protein